MDRSRPRHDGTGIILVVATLLGWASVLLFLKHLTPYIDGWTANGWRYGVSALLWFPLLAAGWHRATLPAGIWRRALVPSILNCIGQACFALTPYYIGAGLAGFLLRVSLIFSTGGALLLFADERMLVRSLAFWIALVLVVSGSVGTVLLGSAPLAGATAAGVALGLCSGAFFGLYGLSVRYYMRGIPAMISFSAISLYSALGLIALMIVVSPTRGLAVLDLSGFNWFVLVSSALIGIAMGHVFYYAALARLGVAVASGVIQLAPFLCAAGSTWLFDERLTAAQWQSGFVMLAGALLLLRAEQRRRSAHRTVPAAPIEPEDAGDPTAISEQLSDRGWGAALPAGRTTLGYAAGRSAPLKSRQDQTMSKPSIIFLCTGNSCRSQMAEGLMRHLAGDQYEVYSAGSHPAGFVHPLAIAAMGEVGIDISRQESKGLDDLGNLQFDYVVTVCDHAAAHCPTLRGRVATLHWPLEDPAMIRGPDREAMQVARRVRDELRTKLLALLQEPSRQVVEG
jgi:arsenate reductase